MAYYSPEEIKSILTSTPKQQNETKYTSYNKQGILRKKSNDESTSLHEINHTETLYNCCTCKKRLSSAHLLDLHVSENHDTFFELQKEKKPSYQCFLEFCKHLSKNPEERKDHCIQKHKFPHDFSEFPRKIKLSDDKQMETSESSSTDSSNRKNLDFQFGHKSQKVFKSKPKTKIDLKDLMDTLPNL